MYRSRKELEQVTLRQGDIVKDVLFVGAINIKMIQTPQLVDGPAAPPQFWICPAPLRSGDAMVLSHSCELARENNVKVTSIILAPIRNVNTATSPAMIQQLIDTNIIRPGETTGSFLKYFYLEPDERLEHADGAIVDFSKCFSIRNKSYEHLLDRKNLELSSEAHEAMARKLALYFYRQQQAS